MNRKRRTEILIKGNDELVKVLANQIRGIYKVQIIEEPNNGLAMIKMRETAKKELFYLGEILLSESKVYVNGVLGMEIIAGDKEELSSNLAIIDAAYNGSFKKVIMWKNLLLEEEQRIKAKENKEEEILATKVNFSTMDV